MEVTAGIIVECRGGGALSQAPMETRSFVLTAVFHFDRQGKGGKDGKFPRSLSRAMLTAGPPPPTCCGPRSGQSSQAQHICVCTAGCCGQIRI